MYLKKKKNTYIIQKKIMIFLTTPKENIKWVSFHVKHKRIIVSFVNTSVYMRCYRVFSYMLATGVWDINDDIHLAPRDEVLSSHKMYIHRVGTPSKYPPSLEWCAMREKEYWLTEYRTNWLKWKEEKYERCHPERRY